MRVAVAMLLAGSCACSSDSDDPNETSDVTDEEVMEVPCPDGLTQFDNNQYCDAELDRRVCRVPELSACEPGDMAYCECRLRGEGVYRWTCYDCEADDSDWDILPTDGP